tara:strand:+ start:305 stop:577 length:273 start_codon:yes stop_codon:yes gene_type:complete
MGRQSGMSQGLTMPADWIRDKFCGGFRCARKSPKEIHGPADCDSVQRGREAAGTRETPQRFFSGMDAVFMLYKSFDSGAPGQLYEVRVRN